MTKKVLFKFAALFAMAVTVSGCGGGSSRLGGECAWYRSSCQYEGSYEPGESEYAEREAARLNRRQSSKLGGGGWFW